MNASTLSHPPTLALLPENLVAVLDRLKSKLQRRFELRHPGQNQTIRQALADAEELAWATSFPHLLLPDYAELRLAEILSTPNPAYAYAA